LLNVTKIGCQFSQEMPQTVSCFLYPTGVIMLDSHNLKDTNIEFEFQDATGVVNCHSQKNTHF